MDITDFLNARIAEDEAAANRSSEGPWHEYYVPGMGVDDREYGNWIIDSEKTFIASTQVWTDRGKFDVEHIARHDPARVLDECKAKRAIMEMADDATGLDLQVDGEFRVGHRDTDDEPFCGDVILYALAAVYADHSDYSKEWAL